MELRTLRYFTVVAKEKNITRAAEILNMSQPPLSSQIHNLEEELGVQLFVRGKRRLKLTAEGELLLRRAQQILDMEDKTRQELANMRNGMTGTISLSLVEGRAPYLAAQWIAGFQEEFPLVRYNLWNGSGDDVLDRLSKGLADLAVIATPYDAERLDGVLVGGEPWVAMIPCDHPLAGQPGEDLPLSSLAGEPLIIPSRKSRVQAIRSWFGEIGAEPNILCQTSNYIDAVALVEQRVGISIFPQTTDTPNDRMVSRVIVQPSRRVEYMLVWNKGQAPSGLAEEFLNYVRDWLEAEETNAFTGTERFAGRCDR